MANSKIVSTIALSSLTAAMLTFSGCGSSDDAAAAAPAVYNPVAGLGITTECLDSATNIIQGNCGVDTTLVSGTTYTLRGKVKVLNGATLTIPAGTTVHGEADAYLVITKGAKIMAQGTAASPVVFDGLNGNGTSGNVGEWGGITVLGNAQANAAGLIYEVDEADPHFAFSTTDTTYNTESSGVMTYLEIYNSGIALGGENKEVNGLSLAGIGSGTTVDNIIIYNSGDDGIELWGGTVDLSNISITNALDDSFDVDNGYVGTVTNLDITQGSIACASLVEMTNSGDAAIVRSNPTIIGGTFNGSSASKDGGLYFKDKDVTGTFTNITINMVANADSDGALHNKEGVNVAPVFSTLTIVDADITRAVSTGDATGITVLDTAIAGTTSTFNGSGL